MIEHGITTTKAVRWAHVCPKPAHIYVYRVKAMLDWRAKQENLWTSGGKSSDGTVTGNGFLVPCGLSFIRRIKIPDPVNAAFPDLYRDDTTDREFGMAAEMAVARLIDLGGWPFFAGVFQASEADQKQGAADFMISYAPYGLEIKADRPGGEPPGTGRLFVQTHERGHRATQTRSSAGLISRDTEFHRHNGGAPF